MCGAANNTQALPRCIFIPRDTSAAAFGIRTLVATSTEFAIRSGGHSTNPGFSSTSSGVLVSLAAIDTINIDLAAGTVTLGSGNIWRTVYSKLATHNVTVAGGRASTVGVGGFSLGGGLSFHLYEHGFAVDNIVAYEVVTAAGKIITVDGENHPDMFVALKGSGAPFALVTTFTYKLLPATPIWGGLIYGSPDSLPAVVKGVAEFMATGIEDPKTHLIAGMAIWSVDGGDGKLVPAKMSVGIYYYRDPIAGPPPQFREMIEAQRKGAFHDTVSSPRDVAGLTAEMAPVQVTRQMQWSWMLTDPTEEVLKRQMKICEEVYTTAVETIPGFAAAAQFIPVGEQGKGDNVLGLRSGVKYLQLQNWIVWSDAIDDEAVMEIGVRVHRLSSEYLRRMGHFDEFV